MIELTFWPVTAPTSWRPGEDFPPGARTVVTRDGIIPAGLLRAGSYEITVKPHDEAPPMNYDEYPLEELREELNQRGMPTSGPRDILIDRLFEDDALEDHPDNQENP